MKVFMTGGTGFVGGYLTERLGAAGHEVTVVSRSGVKEGRRIPGASAVVRGDTTKPGEWQKKVTESDVTINLAGTSIFTYWTRNARRSILESRILTTRNTVNALKEGGRGKLLISASAVGYYGSRDDDLILDESSPAGNEFLSRVSLEWEREALRAEEFGTRVAICRFGIILGRRGGALAKMVPAFKRYLGSALGGGKQWFPWIHIEDLFNIMMFLIETERVSGPVNCVAPNPVRNEELVRTLAKVLKKPVLLPPVPAFVLRTMLGEFGNLLLKGQRVIPRKLEDEGFRFSFPNLDGALEDLLI